MEYQVPQFIEVEDKLVGPLTLNQFIYIAGAGGLCIVFFAYLNLIFAVLFALPVIGLAAALSFYKINGKPFIEVLEAGFNYYTRSKLFLWKHQEQKVSEERTAAAVEAATTTVVRAPQSAPRLTRGKLSELAWSLDVKPVGGTSASREK